MPAILYQLDTSGVDWHALRDVLVADDFHNDRTPEQYRESFQNSAVVCIVYAGDRIIGTARALSDGVCNAYIVDVWTHSDYRKRGIGSEMMRRTLAQLSGQHVYLFTDDAEVFYEQLGFMEQGIGMSLVVGEWLQRNGDA
jgi:predicted GNAT family acetyltransferase